MGVEIVGISRDLSPSHNEFKNKVGAKNYFLSDPDLKITDIYGATRDNLAVKVASRYYFLIDEGGTLIWKNVTGGLIPVDKLLSDLTALLSEN